MPAECISPDKRVRRFVGTQGAGNNMISAIKMKHGNLEDEEGTDFDAILEDDDGPAMIREEELREMQSPFFDGLDDLWLKTSLRLSKFTNLLNQIY